MTTQLYTNRAMGFMMPLMMLVMNCITVLIVWFGAQGVSDGVMQVGNMMRLSPTPCRSSWRL